MGDRTPFVFRGRTYWAPAPLSCGNAIGTLALALLALCDERVDAVMREGGITVSAYPSPDAEREVQIWPEVESDG